MKASFTTRMNKLKKSSTAANSEKTGRPINCFLAFRLEKHREISSRSPGLNHRDISKIIAKWWKDLTEIEKAPYRAIAEKAKADHAKKHPNYKYQPVKKSERKVRPYRRREDASTREQKAIAKKHLLKQWLGEDDDDEEMDCKSETSSGSSISSCSVPMQPCSDDDVHIKLEAVQLDDPYFFSPSLYQPTFHENLIYDNGINPTDNIPDCAFASSQTIPMPMVNDFSSLEFINAPNYVNLQMLSLTDTIFML